MAKLPVPLTREYLDEAGCDTPNCGHDHTVLYLHAGCHPQRGTEVRYDKRTGCLFIRCTVCRAVAEIRVAAA